MTNASTLFGLDFSGLTDMTGAIGAATEFILQDGSTESRKAASELVGDGLQISSGFAVDSTVVRTTGNQSIAGIKTFTDDVVIDNGDGLLIGDSTRQTINAISTYKTQILGTETNDTALAIGAWSTTATIGPGISMFRSRNATLGSEGAVVLGDTLARINVGGSDGNSQHLAGQIEFVAAATTAPANNFVPGDLEIKTTSLAGTLSNALVIDSEGVATHFGDVIIDSSNIAMYQGNSNVHADYFVGIATETLYGDVAEKYESDMEYLAGTVVVFGGEKEITVSQTENDHRVAGVISTEPALLMNSGAPGQYMALTGRVPCMVVGPVEKGDLMVTSGEWGAAKANNDAIAGRIIGKALETCPQSSPRLIEVLVNLM